MKEHGQYISGIDWCEKTNMIVTCSHDRNAYVWKLSDKGCDSLFVLPNIMHEHAHMILQYITPGEWEPTLVVLRIARAATDVKWSPNGDKFAVTV